MCATFLGKKVQIQFNTVIKMSLSFEFGTVWSLARLSGRWFAYKQNNDVDSAFLFFFGSKILVGGENPQN